MTSDPNNMDIYYRRRNLAAFLTILMVFIGASLAVAVLVRGLLGRQARIEETREKISGLLSELDPVARIQVAQYVVEKELDRV